ncbi:MAG: hypothetical protein WDZ39_00725 [Candidatus Spechtbacterales bacterium]
MPQENNIIPENTVSTKKPDNKTMALFASFFIGGLVLGLLFVFVFGPHAQNKELERENNILKEYLRANMFFNEEGLEEDETQAETRVISGTAEAIKGSVIKLDTGISEAEMIVTERPRVYSVAITEDTAILLRKEKDWQVYQEELEEYERAVAPFENAMMEDEGFEATDLPPYPLSYEESEITLNDIDQGTRVQITVTGNLDSSNLEAMQIIVNEFSEDEMMEDDLEIHGHEEQEEEIGA